MIKVFGLCNLHSSASLQELTSARPIASTSFLGRYALIDFPLSNFSNSGIDEVGILIKNHPRSILKHLGSTNVWNTNTKLGYEAILYNEKHAHHLEYNHDINNMLANDWIFHSARPDLFVIAPSHIIFSFDYRLAIEQHLKKEADITAIYTRIDNGKEHFLDGIVLSIDEHNHISKTHRNRGAANNINVALESYIISSSKLIEIIKIAQKTSAFFNFNDVICHLIEHGLSVYTYLYQGYVRCYNSLSSYYRNCLELLDYQKRRQLFIDNWPIYTITHDTPPSKYGVNAKVNNSFIANGAQVNGTVNNSIISRQVIVEEGAKINNSIIFTDSIIGRDVVIENAIIDKYVRIGNKHIIKGNKLRPFYIKQGEAI
jgi:glucose-1-phosphate adenylyltransferase